MTARDILRSGREIRATKEYRRIQDLPRRPHAPPDPAELTALLRTQQGQESLRPVQAFALTEIGEHGRLLGPLRVGSGKTLISLLAPYVLDAKRPILLLPASLVEKTERERRRLSLHWRIPRNLRILSYEMLGRVAGANELEKMRPDVIIADECHKLKNKRAGVTRRVTRYMREHPETVFVAMSGTLIRNSLRDFAHIAEWTHKDDGSPIPTTEEDLGDWADALDAKVASYNRVAPGVMGASTEEARERFRDRLLSTPGVVATANGDDVDCSLYIRALQYDVSAVTEGHFRTLRTLWEKPDGFAITEAVDVWRTARELSLGMHYAWEPRAPEEWLQVRRAWAKFVRDTISRSKTLDTELQVVNACDDGKLDATYLKMWREIRPTFTINAVPRWHDDSALEVAAKWLKEGPGIVWVEHRFFAEELARRTGVPYFGANGLDAKGRYIEDARGPIIASVAANATGKNLQRWHRNLVTAPMAGDGWEQLLGRTHRPGQLADAVECDVMMACAEHIDSWEKSIEAATMISQTQGHSQKVLTADISMDIVKGTGARWTR